MGCIRLSESGRNNPLRWVKGSVYGEYISELQRRTGRCSFKDDQLQICRRQDGNADIAGQIGEMYVDYKFELTPGQTYNVEVCVGNNWSNSSPVNVYANYLSEKQLNGAEQSEAFSVIGEDVEIAPQDYTVVTGQAKADEDGILTINVRRPLPLSNATINVNYICIRQAQDISESLETLNSLLERVEALDTDSLPEREKAIVEKAIGFAEEVAASDLSDDDLVIVDNASATLKYAINEVNKVPDSTLLYFVDCGDHGTSTVTDGDKFGQFNTRTDQIYGEDPGTGMLWGVDDPNGNSSGGAGLLNDEGVYTQYTWAHERDQVDGTAQDNLDKNTTFRYAHGQVENGIDPRYVTYRFQVDSEDGTYPVEVGLGNIWGNSGNPDVYANLGTEGETVISEDVSIETEGNEAVSAEVQAVDGFITIDVRSSDDTINVNWIKIGTNQTVEEKVLTGIEVTPPSKTEYEIGEEFDGSGMTVTARYSDGSAKTLEAGTYFVSGFSSVKAGEVMVTVSYTEGDVTKTAEFTVTVNPGEEPGGEPGKDPGEEPGGEPDKEPGRDPSGNPDKDPGTDTTVSESEAVQTGDKLSILPAVTAAVMAVSAGTAVITVKYRKRRR